MIARAIAILVASVVLAGCAHNPDLTSIQGGESKVFEAPKYEVLGKTSYDQNWIDSQVEGGVAAYGWKRPLPRPPEIDAGAAPVPRKAAPKHARKKSIFRKIKDRILPSKKRKPVETVAPAEPPPVPVVTVPDPVPPPQPAPPPRPRDPVDELLRPSN